MKFGFSINLGFMVLKLKCSAENLTLNSDVVGSTPLVFSLDLNKCLHKLVQAHVILLKMIVLY